MVYTPPKNKKMYTLVLNLPASVRGTDERFDFEPLSWWVKQEDGSDHVTQRVYLDGGWLFGESGTYQEQLSDVVRDFDRFVSLTPIK